MNEARVIFKEHKDGGTLKKIVGKIRFYRVEIKSVGKKDKCTT